MPEAVERRVLGAMRLVDQVTGLTISQPLQVTAPGVKFIQNHSRLYVLTQASGLQAHTRAFENPPAEPPLGSIKVEVRVTDPKGDYLPRIVTLRLPRNPEPRQFRNDWQPPADWLFAPVEVRIYRTVTTTLNRNWSTISVLVEHNPPGGRRPARGALLRVVRPANGSQVLARALTNTRGEALVVIPGIPLTTFAEGNGDAGEAAEVVIADTEARLEVQFDPDSSWPLDPDRLETEPPAGVLTATREVQLRAGRLERMTITL